MTIASASLLYAYYARFPRKKSSGYNKGYSKRSVEDPKDYNKEDLLEKVYETFELLQNLEDSLTLIGINTRDCQLRAVCDIIQAQVNILQEFRPPLQNFSNFVQGVPEKVWKSHFYQNCDLIET